MNNKKKTPKWKYPYWGTGNEIRWLEGLGSHRPEGKQGFSRKQLLEKYIAIADLREWNDMDKERVLEVAQAMLHVCQQGGVR